MGETLGVAIAVLGFILYILIIFFLISLLLRFVRAHEQLARQAREIVLTFREYTVRKEK